MEERGSEKIMKPRERVLTALRRGIPDQVPWMEISVDETLQVSLMGTAYFEALGTHSQLYK